jgi:hypothetical protein
MNALLVPKSLTERPHIACLGRVCEPAARTPKAGSRLMAFRRAPESFELRKGPQSHDANVFDLLRIEP